MGGGDQCSDPLSIYIIVLFVFVRRIADPHFLALADPYFLLRLHRSGVYRTSAAAAPINSPASSRRWDADSDGRHADDATELSRMAKGGGGSGKRPDPVRILDSARSGRHAPDGTS